jgi:nucleotide-binding universal stress UspA family protein
MANDRILVPLDGSDLAEQAIDKALELADPERSTVILLRSTGSEIMPGLEPAQVDDAEVREAEQYLVGVAERLARGGLKRVARSIWFGSAADAIVEAARLMRVDLIVMGTHGRSGLGRAILGSVAESVLRGTAAPLLLVRSPEAPLEARAGHARPRDEAPGP